MEETIKITGYVKWEVWRGDKWQYGGETHNVTNVQYKRLVAQQLATGVSGVIGNKMTAGTNNTSFTANSTNLTTEVGNSVTLTNTYTGTTTKCETTILFAGSYTILEIGLWFGAIPLAFTNITESVTSINPLRLQWSIVHA
jgi:hypothetical protein